MKVDLESLLPAADFLGDDHLGDEDFLIPNLPVAGLAAGSDAPFCGRAQELSRLLSHVEQSVRERRLCCALLSAAPGLGKTRLLRELSRLCVDPLGLPSDRILIGTVQGGALPGDAGLPLSAFREQLRARCGIAAGDAAQTAREKLQRACRALLPPVRATEVSQQLADFLGLSAAEAPPAGDSERDARPRGAEPRSHAALRRFYSADAARAPLVLLFDGVETAGTETLELLRYLSDSLSDLPVFIGLFARPELAELHPDCVASRTGLVRIELPPLSAEEAAELFCLAVGAEVAALPPVLLRLIQNAEGSPRVLVELVRLLIESGVVTWAPLVSPDIDDDEPTGGAPLLTRFDHTLLAQLALPTDTRLDLAPLVAVRLSLLPPPTRRLLERAAVCGQHFFVDALLMLKRCDDAGIAISAEDTDNEGFVVDDPDGALAGEGTSGGPAVPLPVDDGGDRSTLGATLDQLVAQGVLARVLDSRLRGECGYRFAYDPWRDHVYELISPSRRRRYHRLISQWLLLHPEQDSDDVMECVGRHMERAGLGAGAAIFYHRVAQRAVEAGGYARASRLLLRALACLGSSDMGLRVGLWHELGAALVRRGDLDAALGAYQKLLRLSHVLAVRHHRAAAHYALGQIYRHKGEPALALDHLRRALDDYTEIADLGGISDALDDLGQVLWLLGRIDEALDRTARALEIRRRLSDRRKEALSLLHIGTFELHRGLLDPAISCYEEALRKHDGDPQLLAACQEALGGVDLLRGDAATARGRFEQGLASVEKLPGNPLLAPLHCRLGEVNLETGQIDEAERQLQLAREHAQRSSDRRVLSEVKRLLAFVYLRRDDQKRALEASQKALDYAQKSGVRHAIARALLALGEVHASTLFDETVEGQHPAWDCFRRSVTLLREVGDQAELAVALYQMGRHLIERGRLGPARNTLREASDIATRLRLGIAYEMTQMLAEL